MLEVIRPKSLKDSPEIRAMTIDEETKFVNYIISKDLKDCPNNSNFIDTNSYENKKNNSKPLPPER